MLDRGRKYRVGHIIQPQYTDLAVMLGANVRAVEEDFLDLNEAYPEVFLGYRMRLATPSIVAHGGLRGYWIKKLVVSEHAMYDDISRDWYSVMLSLEDGVACAQGSIECWHIHRGRGIYRTSYKSYDSSRTVR